MRILHCITGMSGDGAQRMLLRLATSLQSYGVESDVINLGRDDSVARSFEDAGIRVISLNLKPSPIGGLLGLFRIRSIITSSRPDLIQGWMYHANILVSIAERMNPGHRCPVFWNIRRGLDDFNERSLKTRLVIKSNACLSGIVNRIVYCSKVSRVQHEAYGFSSELGCVLENGFDHNRFKPSDSDRVSFRKLIGIGDNEIVIGNVGRYDVAKGHKFLVEAFAELARSRPYIRLLLIGRGVDSSNHELVARIRQAGLSDRITLLGERDAIHRIYPAMDIYCSASINEGFPNALSEALACGIPCVATNTGASRELVEGLGFVVESKQVTELSAAMQLLADMPEEQRRSIGVASRERIVSRYSLEAITAQYSNVYHQAHYEYVAKSQNYPIPVYDSVRSSIKE